MGIPGLTTYISNNSERYLEPFELHDTYLVIDGNCVACQLYNWYAKCNCAFGGDYDKYAHCVREFFDGLLKCNIVPLVLIDGGCEDKKLKTVLSRTKDKIKAASYYTPLSQSKTKFFPLLNKEVFKSVMTEKGIRYAQCLFEADNMIAATARILNCPVLSYDSDFYIYGVMYIPFSTMDNYLIKNCRGDGYVKRCKIFRVESLLNVFRGLDKLTLPLAAVLLGNDYIHHGTFRNVYQYIKLPKAGKRKNNEQQRRIQAILNWLRRQTLDNAIVTILSRLPIKNRQSILAIIEQIINGYISSSTEMLLPLGFPAEYVMQINSRIDKQTYRFEGDIYNLSYIEEILKEDEVSSEEGEDNNEDEDVTEFIKHTSISSTDAFIKSLPAWFVHDFVMGNFPSYFIDILIRELYVCPIQIEDYCYPSSMTISLKIISTIGTLLKSGYKRKGYYMQCTIRGEHKKLLRYKLQYNDYLLFCNSPSLFNLRDIPLIIRREILNTTLCIDRREAEYCVNELPSNWVLYVIIARYWADNLEELTSHCHVYALIFSMLYHIIDFKIGYYRSMKVFENRFKQQLQEIEAKQKAMKHVSNFSENVTILQACNEVSRDDCLMAASFFISNFQIDQKLLSNPKKFNVSTVHIFAQFQSCLRHCMNLNALLGYPYEQTKISDMFNGTLLYNLYTNFKKRNDVEEYISIVLQNSPSLLRLFNLILLKIKTLFNLISQNKPVNNKRRKTRCKLEKDESKDDTECDSLIDPEFYDVNNPYTLLNTIMH